MKVSITFITVLILSLLSNSSIAQNIFPEKFVGCNTDRFALESDTTTAKINSSEFIDAVKAHLGTSITKKLRGTLRLQVVVDLEGNSCLLSLENKTNIKTKKLRLKPWVDNDIKWNIPSKKVSAIIVLDFTDTGIGYRRLGMKHMKWHYIE
ncbi:hypothetical protein [Flammeovirga sp. SJP92]|uniref:hypothetical protein n=1 Tax=Flammeovirga sp. SJP92 TaxID=1775430 RepID=UPI000788D67E|nr:hypothetical protein [Flammeovirga sp. SJP92]KXX66798.1 hypothetical protein AVL50_30155 [Flammeovirga sp. SJP92]